MKICGLKSSARVQYKNAILTNCIWRFLLRILNFFCSHNSINKTNVSGVFLKKDCKNDK